MKRRLASAAITLVAILLIAGIGSLIVLDAVLTPEYLSRVVNRSLQPATKGMYRVEIGDVQLNWLTASLDLGDIRTVPNKPLVDSLLILGTLPSIRLKLEADALSIQGVDFYQLIGEEQLIADRIRVDRPRVALVIAPPQRTVAQAPMIPLDLDETRLHESIRESLPRTQIQVIEIRNADLRIEKMELATREKSREVLGVVDEAEDLNITIENFDIVSEDPASSNLILFSDDVRISLRNLRLREIDPDHDLEITDLETSTEKGSLRIGSARFLSRVTRQEYLAGGGHSVDHVTLETGSVTLEKIDYWRLTERLEVFVDHVGVERFNARLLSDHGRAVSEESGPVVFPHDVFQELPVRVAIGSIHMSSASVEYSELAPEGEEPGRLTFDGIEATVTNISNDPARMTLGSPAILVAQGYIQESLPISLRLAVPLLAPRPTMSVAATCGSFAPEILNDFLVEVDGVRIVGGKVDEATIEAHYAPGQVRGRMSAVYRDLSLRKERLGGESQNLSDKIVSFAMNAILIRGSSDPDDGQPPRTIEFQYEVEPEHPFFKTFWFGLRAGILEFIS